MTTEGQMTGQSPNDSPLGRMTLENGKLCKQ